MKLTYFGHSCFLLETGRHRIVLDPFLDANPAAPIKSAALDCDHVICSHGHDDHCADALALARRCDATIVGNFELCEFFARQGARTHGMNPGGGHTFPFGHVRLTLAFHSSSTEIDGRNVYLGAPCGFVLTVDGRRLYHAGDTALFSDMQLIGRAGLDLALVPIGDNFTMGPDDALLALDYLRPKLAVPIHYNTWPLIAQDGDAFAARARAQGHAVRVLRPGESLEF